MPDVPNDEILFTAMGEDVSVSDAFDGFFIIKVKRPPEQTVVIEATPQKAGKPGKGSLQVTPASGVWPVHSHGLEITGESDAKP